MPSKPYIDLDCAPPSSQLVPILDSDPVHRSAVRWVRPAPSNPELRRIFEDNKDNIEEWPSVQPTTIIPPPGPSSPLTVPASCQNLDRAHPAFGRNSSLQPQQPNPSADKLLDCFTFMVGRAREIAHANAIKKAKKSPSGRVTKSHPDKKSALNRAHSTEPAISSAQPLATSSTSRLKSCASDPAIALTTRIQVRPNKVDPAFRPLGFDIEKLIKESERDLVYDFPSSTPTPPPKQQCRARSSSSVLNSQLSSTSSPLNVHHHDSSPLQRQAGTPRHAPTAHPTILSPAISSPSRRFPPVPYRPSLSPMSPAAPSPPHPPHPIPQQPQSQITPSQPLVVTPAPPLPSQNRPSTQVVPPRASQYPKPLGMRSVHGRPLVYQPKKAFKPPIAKKPPYRPPALVSPATSRKSSLSTSSATSSEDGGGSRSRPGRSLSPIIPDPSHILAKAKAKATNAPGPAPPVLEMSARKPERSHESQEDKDANSSADMWEMLGDF